MLSYRSSKFFGLFKSFKSKNSSSATGSIPHAFRNNVIAKINKPSTNRGCPPGDSARGNIVFSHVNDIRLVSPSSLLIKFSDDINVSIPVRAEDSNIAESEVSSIMKWAGKNQMTLSLNKTWEMLLKSGSLKVPPACLPIVDRKTKLKLLGVTCEDDPVNWDLHIDNALSKAGLCLYILSVCSFYG